MVYIPRHTDAFGEPLLVRFQGDAGALERAFANAIRDMDRDAIGVPRTLRSMIDDMASRSRDLVVIVLILGILAVLLAVIGIYGVVAFAVARRTRELGIRMALGATKGEIVRFVFRSGMRSVLAGLATGSLLAVGASQVLAQVLGAAFAPNPWDPIIYVAVAAMLASAALAAMFGPAQRAASSDPMRALRND
jgi:ABC-type antimicrobial peptide transport system permease subunit